MRKTPWRRIAFAAAASIFAAVVCLVAVWVAWIVIDGQARQLPFIESGVAADYPGIRPEEAQERLGQGAGLFLHDSSMIPTLSFRDFFIDTAKAANIPLQFNVLSGYGEDGAEMQKSFSGIPAVNVTVPTRYLHNHNGIIARSDFDHAVNLVVAVIRKLDRPTIDRLKRFD